MGRDRSPYVAQAGLELLGLSDLALSLLAGTMDACHCVWYFYEL